MASRLSQEPVSHKTPQRTLSAAHGGGGLPAFSTVDLTALLQEDDGEERLQSLPEWTVYQSLVAGGLEDQWEVLPHLAPEQFHRCLDFDIWRAETLVPEKAMRWLKLCLDHSPAELFRRFHDLEEELQISLLQRYIYMFDAEEYEKLPEAEQDKLEPLPCHQLFYGIASDSAETVAIVEALIQAGLASDLNYTYALLAHAANALPNESEAQARKFREARIAEDGFVPFEEALKSFAPLAVEPYMVRWSQTSDQSSGSEPGLQKVNFTDELLLPKVLRQLDLLLGTSFEDQETCQVGYARAVNAVASAVHLEAGDFAGLRHITEHFAIIASLALEHLSGGSLERAARIVVGEHATTLFRIGYTLVQEGRAKVLAAMAERHGVLAAKLTALSQQNKFAALLKALETVPMETFGHDGTEVLRGLLSRFPLRPLVKDGKVTFIPLKNLADWSALMELGRAAVTQPDFHFSNPLH